MASSNPPTAQSRQGGLRRHGNQAPMPHQFRLSKNHVELNFLGPSWSCGTRVMYVSDLKLADELRDLNERVKKEINALHQGLITEPGGVMTINTPQCVSVKDVEKQCTELCVDLKNMQKDFCKWKFLLNEDYKKLSKLRHLPVSDHRDDANVAISVLLKEAMQCKHMTVGDTARTRFNGALAAFNREKVQLLWDIHDVMHGLADRLEFNFRFGQNTDRPDGLYEFCKNDWITAFGSMKAILDAFCTKFSAEFGRQRKVMDGIRKKQEELYKRVNEQIKEMCKTIEQKLISEGPNPLVLSRLISLKAVM